jgi:hypothetical protein
LGIFIAFGVLGKLAMVAVTLEENPESQAPSKSLAATWTAKSPKLRARQRIEQENEKKAGQKLP